MTRTSLVRPALYARVSSEQQAEAGTIASQLEALRQRVRQDDLALEDELCFADDGYSGTTLLRPALERLRDVAAAGGIDRLYVYSPDRLSRKYAYQVLLLDELRRGGVEVVFLNSAIGDSPEQHLLLQVQGMLAEYERAQLMERCRRGKLHTARAGGANALAAAPYGYRYVRKADGGGVARFDVLLEEARVVRQIFEWVGCEHVSLAEVARRLQQQGIRTRTGQPRWDRSTLCDMLKNPAYIGTAVYGRTRVGPRRPRLRPPRGQPDQPRRPYSTYETPSPGIVIPVPVLVSAELFAAVGEQLEENRRRNRRSARGRAGSCKGCCNVSTAATRFMAWGRSIAWQRGGWWSTVTTAVRGRTPAASAASACARIGPCRWKRWTTRCGRMSVPCCKSRARSPRSTSGGPARN